MIEKGKEIVKPQYLKAGDKVALISPAYWVPEEVILKAAEVIRSWGLLRSRWRASSKRMVLMYCGNERFSTWCANKLLSVWRVMPKRSQMSCRCIVVIDGITAHATHYLVTGHHGLIVYAQ